MIPNILKPARFPPTLADLLQMPKSIRKKQEEEELTAYTARWLELADAALSATKKAAKSLGNRTTGTGAHPQRYSAQTQKLRQGGRTQG
jgi:uncharacterized protein YicC (UPF0701 family)